MMRIGVFGGSFDPIHYGHLLLAETAREQLELNEVLLIPAAKSPLKQDGPVADNTSRMEMLRLAIGNAIGLVASDREIARGGTSYTIDTLASIIADYSGSELFLIVGSDQLPVLNKWHQPQQISAMATWAWVERAGHAKLDWELLRPYVTSDQLVSAQRSVVQMPAWDLSSQELRRRAAQGKNWRFRTPRAVEEYARSHQLYGFSRQLLGDG
jgi:nicotinate-nucleotide adenylyltransferase